MKTRLYNRATSVMVTAFLAGSLAQARVVDFVKEDMEKLLGHAPKVTNVYQGQQLGLDHGSATVQPWSGSEWPDLAGGIADHYRIHKKHQKFKKGWEHSREPLLSDQNYVRANVKTWSTQQIAQNLSPSEKYDLLLGDLKFSFSDRIVQEIDFRNQYKQFSKLVLDYDPWRPNFKLSDIQGSRNTHFLVDADEDGNSCKMTGKGQVAYKGTDQQRGYTYWSKEAGGWLTPETGLNYGWAGASVFLPRPIKPVMVRGATGQMIIFYPEDLKALGSYLFAHTTTGTTLSMPLSYQGRPCADPKGPEQDDAGWIKDIRCNDLDPAIFHLTLLNRMGLEHSSVLIDVDNTAQIKNVPISRYSMSYFNPATGASGTLNQARTPVRGLRDTYVHRRSPLAQFLVGVKATVTLVGPHGSEDFRGKTMDSAKDDSLYTHTYFYDLELDSKGNILGGEWGNRSDDLSDEGTLKLADQPDFIWTGDANLVPTSAMSGFNTIDQWDFSRTPEDPVTHIKSRRPFGNVNWAWDGKREIPKQWKALAKKDEQLGLPTPGVKKEAGKATSDVLPLDAIDSSLRSPQPYSNIVYYLFDQARDPAQR